MGEAEVLANKIMTGLDESGHHDDARISDLIRQHTPADSPAPGHPFHGAIESIRVRGIRAFGEQQQLELSRGLTIVYAENGSGKTSLVDALELLTRGSTTRSRQFPDISGEVKDEDHIGHTTAEGRRVGPQPRVCASWLPTLEAASRHSAWETTWGAPAEDAPPAHLLARRRLREVINAKGVDRAAHLEAALGLGPTIETWREAHKHLLSTATELEKADGLSSDIVDQARACVDDATTQALDEDALTTRLQEQARAHINELLENDDGGATPLSEFLARNVEVPPAPPSADPLNDLAAKLARTESRSPSDDAASRIDDETLALLKAFRQVTAPGRQCAACQDGHVSTDRLVEVDALLKAEQERQQRADEIDALQQNARMVLERCSAAALIWRLPEPPAVKPSTSFEPGLQRFLDAHEQLRRRASEWSAQHDAALRSLVAAKAAPHADSLLAAATALGELSQLHAELTTEVDAIENLRAIGRSTSAPQRAPALTSAQTALDTAPRVAKAATKLRRQRARAQAYKKAAKELKVRIDTVLVEKCGELAEPINTWLHRLAHEHTPPVSVVARRTAGRTALDILVSGSKVKAVGRLSDSQLDMLGLAAHLATLERETPGQPLFIDDPTDMLDHATRERFAGEGLAHLLRPDREDRIGRQIVILTHDHDLVRALWRHHGDRMPCTMQTLIELDRRTDPPHAVFTPRNTQQYLDRLDTLLHKHSNEGDRVWLRSAVGNQARQALESILKDVLVVLGPQSLDLVSIPRDKKLDFAMVTGKVLPEIRTLEERFRQCGAAVHRQALSEIKTLLDHTGRSSDYLLNEASHADLVHPSIREIKSYAQGLRKLANLLAPEGQQRPDEWPLHCKWARYLQPCQDCPEDP